MLPNIVNVPPSKSTVPDQLSFASSITTPLPAAVDVIFNVDPFAIVKAASDVIAESLIRFKVELS